MARDKRITRVEYIAYNRKILGGFIMNKFVCFVVGLLYQPLKVVNKITEEGDIIISNYKFCKRLEKNLKNKDEA